MSKEKVAIDVDDVLAGNAVGFTTFSNERWGTSLIPEDYDEHWAEMWAVDHDEAIRRSDEFFNSDAIRHYDHDDMATPVLQRLSDDYDLIIATSRRMRAKNHTIEWVHERYPGIFCDETINFAGIWDAITTQSVHMTKADMVRKLGADYLIDDQLKHCKAVGEMGRRALLFGNYAWNQSSSLPANVVRVADWYAVEEYFYGSAKAA